ncbi:unnamed protein product [Rotaria sp. Silwood1]|nr:unnamed protein product [Rotaria sp. Silwood1]
MRLYDINLRKRHCKAGHSDYFSYLIIEVNCQVCSGAFQYESCSTNNKCGCFQVASDNGRGVCAFLRLNCSQLSGCETEKNICQKLDHICVYHPHCYHSPVWYPLAIARNFCPVTANSSSILSTDNDICGKVTWSPNGTTVAGGNGQGSELNQLNYPFGLFIDNNQTIYIADSRNNRIVQWFVNQTSGQIIAGNGKPGNDSNQLNNPQDIFIDNNGTIYITDTMNGRIQMWFKGDLNGTTIVENIDPIGIIVDTEVSIYVTDWLKGQLTKWFMNGTVQEIIVSNLTFPYMVFLDKNQSIYISDTANSTIIKVDYQTKNVSIVAGGSSGGDLNQLSWPEGVFVDDFGTVYVADTRNHRIMQWTHEATYGNVIAGGKGPGSASNQLYYPSDLSFDFEGNLYVVDNGNHRVQKFIINKNPC